MSKLKSIIGVFAKAPLIIDYVIFAIAALGCLLLFQGINAESIITGLIYPVCGIVVYKIAEEIGMGPAKSKLCAYAAVTMPIGLSCQYIFGESQALMVLLVLVGFYFWLKDNGILFLLCFAVATFFGGLAFPVFAVLLLLKQKKLLSIFVNIVCVLLPVIVRFVIKLTDDVYREEVFDLAVLNTQGPVMPMGILALNISIFAAIFIAVYAYIHKTEGTREDGIVWALYLVGLMIFAMFGFGGFELSELILIAPFLTISAFLHKDTKIFMALDILLMLFLVLFAVNEFTGIADETLFLNGIKGEGLGNGIINKTQMKDVLIYQDKSMILSFFSVLLMVSVIFKHPKFMNKDFKAEVVSGTVGFVRTRFIVGVAFFVVPALLCYISAMNPPYVTMYTPDVYDDISYMITDRQNSEVFIATKGKLESVEFMVGTCGRPTEVDVTVRIVDATNETVLHEEVVNMYGYSDNDWVYIDTDGIELTPGGTYRLDIVCFDADASNAITLYRTKDLSNQTHGFAFIDGERQDYHLCVKIMEDYISS